MVVLSPKLSAHCACYRSRWDLVGLMVMRLSSCLIEAYDPAQVHKICQGPWHTLGRVYFLKKKGSRQLDLPPVLAIFGNACVLFLFCGSIITVDIIVINDSWVAARMSLRIQWYDGITCVHIERLKALKNWGKWTSVCVTYCGSFEGFTFSSCFEEVYEFRSGPNQPQAVWIHTACDWDFHI